MNGEAIGLHGHLIDAPHFGALRGEVDGAKRARNLSPAEAFYLGTNGDAQTLAKANIIGTLAAGKEADVTVIDFNRARPYPQLETNELSPEDMIALCIYRGGAEITAATYARGRCVFAPDAT